MGPNGENCFRNKLGIGERILGFRTVVIDNSPIPRLPSKWLLFVYCVNQFEHQFMVL